MNRAIVILVAACLVSAVDVKRVFDLTQIVNFGSKFQTAFGCHSPPTSEFALGTFNLHGGISDAMNIIESGWQLQVQPDCIKSRPLYYRLFGTDEDYGKLLTTGAESVSRDILNNNNLKNKDLIIDWQDVIDGKTPDQRENTWNFIKGMVKSLGNQYVRLPAATLCALVKDPASLREIGAIKGFIIEMFGRGSSYQDFESIFTKTAYPNESGSYSAACPRSPSFNKLREILGDKPFFIAKTLNQHIKGYVWNFEELLNRAVSQESLNITRVFFDDFPENMIRL